MAALICVIIMFTTPAVVSSQTDFFTPESTVAELIEASTVADLLETATVTVNPTPVQLFQRCVAFPEPIRLHCYC